MAGCEKINRRLQGENRMESEKEVGRLFCIEDPEMTGDLIVEIVSSADGLVKKK